MCKLVNNVPSRNSNMTNALIVSNPFVLIFHVFALSAQARY